MRRLRAMVMLAAVVAMGTNAGAAILLDVGLGGSLTSTTGWNNLSALNSSNNAMVDSTGAPTPVTFDAANWGGANNTGTTAAVSGPSGPYPSTASFDFFFVSPPNTATITFHGLGTDPLNVTLFASRAFNAVDRVGVYTLTGANSASITIDATGANGGIGSTTPVTLQNILPTASGDLTLSVAAASGSTFAYLNVVEINAVPEPGSLALAGGAGLALLLRRRSA